MTRTAGPDTPSPPGGAAAVEPLIAAAGAFVDLAPGEDRATLRLSMGGRSVHGLRIDGHRAGLRIERVAVLDESERPAPGVVLREEGARTWNVTLASPVASSAVLVDYRLDDDRMRGGLRVTTRGRWRSHTAYDRRERLAAWQHIVDEATRASPAAVAPVIRVLDLTVHGDYARAHRLLVRDVQDAGMRNWFRSAVTEQLLLARGIEWTTHGPSRPFRLWSEEERRAYVAESATIVAELELLTPDVCLGFGSVLAAVRDHALIPHDDDIDVIVGFEPTAAPSIQSALERLTSHLTARGIEVSGEFLVHRHVSRPGGRRVDVFVGIFEGPLIAWYPGPREGLDRDLVFPPVTTVLLGVPVRIPRAAERYLEHVYGPGWRSPDPHFQHAWNAASFASLTDVAPGPGGDAPVSEGVKRPTDSEEPA